MSNSQIVLNALASGPKTLAELAQALLNEGKEASNAIAGCALRNARRANCLGATIVSLGKSRYALAETRPEGVRFMDVWQIKHRRHLWMDTECQTQREAIELRARMIADGLL